jgi:hypothetical protein
MSPLNTALLAGVVAATLSSGWHYHDHQSRSAEAAKLRLENDRLRQLVSPTSPASIATSSPPTPSENGPPPITTSSPGVAGHATLAGIDHLDAGQATPIDALQTFVWACEQGEAARVETIIEFDSAARAKAAEYYESIPAHVRKQWRTLEAMAATLLISEGLHYPYPVASVLRCAEVQSLEPDRVVLLMPGTRRPRLEFQHTSHGWKYVVTEAMVDEYLAERAGSNRRQP